MNIFQTDCQNAIKLIPEEDIAVFNAARDAESRIKAIFKYANTIPVRIEVNKKNMKIAEEQKAKGNSLFAKKEYRNAIKSYNRGIMNCPQDSDSAKEFLTILIANRSAAFFEMDAYRKVLNDIDYITEIDHYPKHLHYKIWLRKAKCYEALNNERSANEAYNQAFEYFKFSGLTEQVIAEKIEGICKTREKNQGKSIMPECCLSSPDEENFTPSEIYVASHNKVVFEQDMVQGRYARAGEDIPAGELIIIENPHGYVLAPDTNSTNCQNCFMSTSQIVACPGCSIVVFCSSNCERIANRTYHKYECAFLNTLHKSGASINCALALRIISQKNAKYFVEKKLMLRDYLKDNCKKPIKKIDPYRSDDYNTVFFLCRNEFSRSKEELLHFSCMAVFLFKLLKISNYFPESENNNDENEFFVTALILRHLELLQFNCHEVAELRNTNDVLENDNFESLYKLDHIGAALYPTASLFNHSCDPSIVRYNIGNKLIVRTIKPIEEGETIYENYGPLYTTMKKEFRQEYLSQRYWFECFCTPCMEQWPLLEKMSDNELRISCSNEKCPYIFVIHKEDFIPFLVCKYCGSNTNMFPILKKLMDLQKLLPSAENLYSNGLYREASKIFLEALEILYKQLRPPCPDMVKIQQRLRTCYIHLGNKSIDYIYTH